MAAAATAGEPGDDGATPLRLRRRLRWGRPEDIANGDAVALEDAGDAGERLCAEEWMNIFSSLTLDC